MRDIGFWTNNCFDRAEEHFTFGLCEGDDMGILYRWFYSP
jgi:hypothetical protein